MGGVRYIFLTHRDDVADHAKWAAEFGAERIIHESECNAQQGTECARARHFLSSRPGCPAAAYTGGSHYPGTLHAPCHALATTIVVCSKYVCPLPDAWPCDCWCSKCEIKLDGTGPWAVPGGEGELEIIHTPGHT